MYSLNQVNKLVSCGRDPARSLPLWRGFLLIPLILLCFALSPNAQAAPAPETPDPAAVAGILNTADGHNALFQATGISAGNAAFGGFSMFSLTTGSFNTAVGVLALDLNNADLNTAVGAAALLFNNKTTGLDNTGTRNTAVGTAALELNLSSGATLAGDGSFNGAVGAFALLNNLDGFSNNAMGDSALRSNQHGVQNTAVGDLALNSNDSSGLGSGNINTAVGAEALFSNVDGDSNNAVGAAFTFGALGSNVSGNQNNAMGVDALGSSVDGSSNTAMGDSAFFDNVHGSFNTVIGWDAGELVEGNDNIYIGATSGLPGGGSEDGNIRIGDPDHINLCFVAGIAGQSVTGNPVCVDATTGQLGECAAAASPRSKKPLRSPKEWLQQRHAMQQLKATTEKQAAKIALQEGQIQALTAALKQQAEQIQKVSAQLEMIRPTPRVVENR
jgi:hypothetical protein